MTVFLQVTWSSSQVTSLVHRFQHYEVQMSSLDSVQPQLVTIPVAGRGAQAHLLHQVPAQGPYNQKPKSSIPVNIAVSVSLGSFLPSLPIVSCLLLVTLLLMATSLPPTLLPDSLLQEQDLRAFSPWTSSLSLRNSHPRE